MIFRTIPTLVCTSLLATAALGGDTIRIGEYASLTGKEAAYGDTSHKGTLLAIEEINARGGVLGRRIRHRGEEAHLTRQGRRHFG